MISALNLPRKWSELRPEDIGQLEDELARETCPGHPLHGATVKALYRRYPHDDVLFDVSGLDCPYYSVHLTWRAETDPTLPYITRFQSLEDFCVSYEMTREITEVDSQWEAERWRFFELAMA